MYWTLAYEDDYSVATGELRNSFHPHPAIDAESKDGKFCKCFGCAQRPIPGYNRTSGSSLSVPEALLYRLVSAFPQGQLFDLEDDTIHQSPNPDGRDDDDDEAQLRQETLHWLSAHIPGAKSVLFFPLWDWSKTRLLSGSLVWTRKNSRVFEAEGLYQFKVFEDFIVSEIARADWAATQKTKADLISSVSHEMRSPLHGILVSLELSLTTALQPAQREMLMMAEKCGLTLLDTVNYLLALLPGNSSIYVFHDPTNSFDIAWTSRKSTT